MGLAVVYLCLPAQASKVWIQNKMDESKHEIHSQVDAITAGTASVVNLTAGQCIDSAEYYYDKVVLHGSGTSNK